MLVTSIQAMVIDLGIRMGKVFWSFLHYEHDSREYTLQEQHTSPSHFRVWFTKQSDYCFVRSNQQKFLKDIKFLTSEEFITWHNPFVCDFKIRKVKQIRRMFVPKRKIWILHEDSVKNGFTPYVSKQKECSQEDASLEGYRKILKGDLLMMLMIHLRKKISEHIQQPKMELIISSSPLLFFIIMPMKRDWIQEKKQSLIF